MSDTPEPIFLIKEALAEYRWRQFDADPLAYPGDGAVLRVDGQAWPFRSRVLRRYSERVLIADFTQFDPAPAEQDSAFDNFLDLSLFQRALLWMARYYHRTNYVICIEARETALFRSDEERALFRHKGSPEDCPLDLLSEKLENWQDTPLTLSDRDREGRELMGWHDLLSGKLGPSLQWSRSEASRLIRQMLLGLKVQLVANRRLFCEMAGLRKTDGESGVEWCFDRPDAGAFMGVLLEMASKFAPQGSGAFSSLEIRGLCRQIEKLNVGAREAVFDIIRLAHFRHLTPCQRYLLAPQDADQAASKLALVAPLNIAREIESQDLYVFHPLVIDVEDSGSGRILEAVEKLAVFAIDQLEEIKMTGGRQLDMFEGMLDGGQRQLDMLEGLPDPSSEMVDVLSDPYNWICRSALRIQAPEEWRECLAMLVASHIIELWEHEKFRQYASASLSWLPDLFQQA
ncbi:MAG: hypothetical protein ACLFUS_17865 [Candidatus Sumerlaeia bacterium]